jgi:hypothetical protein
VRTEIETKRNEINENETKRNQRNETKQKRKNEIETKRGKFRFDLFRFISHFTGTRKDAVFQ